MKRLSLILIHWQMLLSLVFGGVVFCFWYFLYPYIVVGQERLFVWDIEFWQERNLWEYIKDFFLQFFHYASLGSVLLAILCLGIQIITRKILYWILPNKIKNLLYVLSFIPAVVVWYIFYVSFSYNPEEMEYDWLLRKGRWTEIIDTGNHETPHSLASQNAFMLAQFQIGQISENDLLSSITLTNDALSDRTAAFLMSDVYMYTGMINMAQRASMEAMLSIEDFGFSGRAFQRLVETAIVTKQYNVAKKYILLLEKTLFYRSWALKTRPFVEHPELIKNHPNYGKQQEIYQNTKDVLFN